MADNRGTLDAIIVPVSQALGVVGDLLAVDDGAELVAQLGYKVPAGGDLGALFTDLATEAGNLTHAITAVVNAYEDGSYDQPAFLEDVLHLAKAVVAFVKATDGLPDRANAAFAAFADFLADGGLDQLPKRLVDFLIVRYLTHEYPAIVASTDLLGLTTQTFVAEGDHNPDFYLVEVQWDRIPLVLSDPRQLFADEYGWGTSGFEAAKFLHRLEGLLWLIGLPTRHRVVPDPVDPDAPPVAELEVPLYEAGAEIGDGGIAGIELGLRARRSQPGADENDVGLEVLPYVDGSFEIAINIAEGWELSATSGIDAEAFAINIRPASGVEISAAVAIAAAIAITLRRDGDVLGPLVVFGSNSGTRLQIGELSERVFASTSNGTFDIGFEVALKEGALVVAASEGDGFLKKVLPEEPLSIGFNVTVGFSTTRGLYFSGGAELRYTFHIDAQFGPIFVNTIDLDLAIDASRVSLVVTATGGLALGPVVAVVQDIGVAGNLITGKRGNLGNADFGLSFHPPTGIGLSIDTPTIKAGGFLSIDTERGRYVGAVELSVLKKFDLAAIALITTKMPDGSDGFSLLFIISIVFPVPIPIGYNFYFAGAGGLLGLSRSVDIDRLRDGLRAGTADSILFPTDVVRRIDAIVRDIEEVFPPDAGQFLVGPMALITWSSPTLISVKLGLIIQIGSPIRIAILGVLRAALPDADDPVVDLKVAFLGTIDIAAGLLTFDAAIYDSYIGRGGFKLSFEGDIAVRVSWGAQKDFVSSVGGFNPAFKPAAYLRLPPMRRITLSLLKDNPRITLTAYFAVTTNTVQFGSRLTFYFSVSDFSIVGDFGFDVLFQFSPFHLDAQVWARLAVRSGDSDILSLSLDFRLQGPTPWIAVGKASFKILFFSVSVHFEKRFGEEVHTTLPDIAVVPLVLDEVRRDANWRAELPPDVSSAVTLKTISPPDGTLVIDAGGRLTMSQRILPLQTDFTLFGTSRPSDAERIRVSHLRIGQTETDIAPVFEPFAPAAFRAMPDDDKLKAAAYEQRPSGVQARGDQELRTDHVLARPVAYEMLVQDVATDSNVARSAPAPEPQATFERLVPGGAAGRSSLSRTRARLRETGSVLDAGAQQERFAVTTDDDLRPIGADGQPADPDHIEHGRPVYASGLLLARTDAEARRTALIAGGRSAGAIHIIPEAQLAA